MSETLITQLTGKAYEPVNLEDTITTVSERVAKLNPPPGFVQRVIQELAATAIVTLYIIPLAEREVRRRLRDRTPGQHPQAPTSR